MSSAIYIHYHYNHFSKRNTPKDNANFLNENYNNDRIQRQYANSKKLLEEKIKNIFLTSIKGQAQIEQTEEEFFKLLNDLEKGDLPKAAEDMVSKLPMTTVEPYEEFKDAIEDIEKLQKIIDEFKGIIQKIITYQLNDDNKNKTIITNLVINNININSDIIQEYRDRYLSNNETFKIDDSFKSTLKTHKTNINKILANINGLDNLINNNIINKEIKSKTINHFLWSTYHSLNKITGNISENALVEILPNFIEKTLKNHFNKNGDIVITHVGEQAGNIFAKRTEDVAIEMNLQAMLEGNKEGVIKIKLPGISLKRTRVKNNTAKIHIKTDALLGNFLENMSSDNKNKDLKNFYHAYATYNMSIRKRNKQGELLKTRSSAQLNQAEAKGAMNNMYNFFHASFLPLALGGSLDKEDFAYFMIINDKVYNIIDIIDKVYNADDASFITSNLSKHQNKIKNAHNNYYQEGKETRAKGLERSRLTLNEIHKQKITMILNLSLDKIKK